MTTTLQLPPRDRRASSPSLGKPLPPGFAYHNGRTAWAPTDDGEDVIAFVGGREISVSREEAFRRFGCDCIAGQTPPAEPQRTGPTQDSIRHVRGAAWSSAHPAHL